MRPSTQIEYQQHQNIVANRVNPVGQRFVIIGESSDGPDYSPTLVYNEKMARSIFGEGKLIDRFLDAIEQTDAISIYLMRIEPYTFQLAWDAIEPMDFDLVYVDDFSFGESLDDIFTFIDLAQRKAEQGRLIHGFFDLNKVNAFHELIPTFNLIRGFTHESLTNTYELGKYFSVVYDQFENRKAGVVYAAMVASSHPEVSPVNKPLKAQLSQTFNKDELLAIKDAGIVCFRDSYHNGAVCVSSTCAVGTVGSVHKNITNFRIVQYLLNESYEQLNKFIGQMGPRFHELEVTEILSELLQLYVKAGRIKSYGFTVDVDKLNGYIYTNMEVVPIFTTETITAHTQVRIFK